MVLRVRTLFSLTVILDQDCFGAMVRRNCCYCSVSESGTTTGTKAHFGAQRPLLTTIWFFLWVVDVDSMTFTLSVTWIRAYSPMPTISTFLTCLATAFGPLSAALFSRPTVALWTRTRTVVINIKYQGSNLLGSAPRSLSLSVVIRTAFWRTRTRPQLSRVRVAPKTSRTSRIGFFRPTTAGPK